MRIRSIPARRRWPFHVSRAFAGATICIGLWIGVPAASAQELNPIRTLPGSGLGGCPPIEIVTAAPASRDVNRARALLRAGQEAALIGDQAIARERFAEAARLDPTDPEVAYALARVHEESGAEAEATREFCRYLVLAPGGPDAGEVRQRLESLLATAGVGVLPVVVEHFEAALAFYDAGRLAEAEQALTYVLRESPGLAAAHFNRALVRLAQNRAGPAAEDFERFLELDPEVDKRDAVLTQLAELRARMISPAHALRNGLLVPGLGQITTRRPVLGTLVFGTVAAAAYAAFQTREETRTAIFEDRFGNSYEERFTVPSRPYRDLGIAAALVVTVLAATEAYNHAGGDLFGAGGSSPSSPSALRIAPVVAPAHDGSFRLGIRLPASLLH